MIKEEDDYIYISDNLPKIPFSLLSCGARGSGKSVITCCLLEWLHTYFDDIFIFSPTIELDHKYKLMFDKLGMEFEFGKNIFTDYSESVLTTILAKIKRANKGKPFKDKSRILFIYDDIISLLPKNKRKKPAIINCHPEWESSERPCPAFNKYTIIPANIRDRILSRIMSIIIVVYHIKRIALKYTCIKKNHLSDDF